MVCPAGGRATDRKRLRAKGLVGLCAPGTVLRGGTEERIISKTTTMSTNEKQPKRTEKKTPGRGTTTGRTTPTRAQDQAKERERGERDK